MTAWNSATICSLVALLTLIAIASTCPTDQVLLQRCQCIPNTNGIILDCSNSDFNTTIELLRVNRPQLGLIQEISFQDSSISQLPASVFQGMFIKKLDLSRNQIGTIHTSAFQGMQSVLQILSLSGNNLKEIPTEALNGMTSLLQLDLSNNSIGNLDNADVIVNIPKVFDLNLANNQICRIHKDAFRNVKQSLQTLNVGGNCLDEVPAPAIRGFQQLLALHLHQNVITKLEPLQFMNLPYLNLINLAGNKISQVHQQAFLNVPNLKFMYLGDNEISSLEPQQFRTFENLELLDLSRNKLKTLPQYVFANMARLSQLYLTGNEIYEILPAAFSNSSIVILLIAENRMARLTGEMFQGLNFLQQLSLRDNEIISIAQNTFYQLPSLVVLDLSHNKLTTLPQALFLAQLNLFLLDLSNNQLPTVPYNALNQRIQTVVLQENPLVCNERIHVVQQGVGVFIPGTIDKICGGAAPTFTNSDVPGLPGNQQLPPGFGFGSAQPAAAPAGPPSFVVERIPDETQFHVVNLTANNTINDHGNNQGGGPMVLTFPTIPPGAIRPNNQNTGLTAFAPGPQTQPKPQQPWEFPAAAQPGNFGNQFNQANQQPAPFSNNGNQINPFGLSKPPEFGAQPPINRNNNQNPSIFTFTFPPPPPPEENLQPQTPVLFPQRPTPPPPPPRNPVIDETFTIAVRTETIDVAERPKNNQFPSQNSFPGLAPPPAPFIPPRNFTTEEPTLPPGIVIAPREKTTKFGSGDPSASDVRTVPPKKTDVFGSDAQGSQDNLPDYSPAPAHSSSATTTIAVCLAVVVLVIVVVFITLCMLRHKARTRTSESSASRTSAYVAAQAAQIYPYVNGTGTVVREGAIASKPKSHMGVNSNTWIYAPAAGGPTYGAYYK